MWYAEILVEECNLTTVNVMGFVKDGVLDFEELMAHSQQELGIE